MTTEEKAKAYDEALKRAKAAIDIAADKDLVGGVVRTIFPELRESEDERIRKALIQEFKEKVQKSFEWKDGIPNNAVLDWLEKQKEHFRDDTKMVEQKPRDYCSLRDEFDLEGNLVQKPTSTEDMPYITDEHFYEREPADSFKYKLAEYMTKCCTKKEGPYGYTYGISAEAILKMAEEELLKRGVVQKSAENGVDVIKTSALLAADRIASAEMTGRLKERSEILENPEEYGLYKSAEWSEEDEKMLQRIIRHTESEYQDWCNDKYGNSEIVSDGKRSCLERLDWLENRLKSLRPKSKEELAKMLQEEYNKGKKEGERIGHTIGYNKGYKDAEEAYNKTVSYHP